MGRARGEGGKLLPSLEMEDREEKADYPTVVVHGLEIQEKRARVRSFKQGDNSEWKETAGVTENVLLLIFESVTAHSKNGPFESFPPAHPPAVNFLFRRQC